MRLGFYFTCQTQDSFLSTLSGWNQMLRVSKITFKHQNGTVVCPEKWNDQLGLFIDLESARKFVTFLKETPGTYTLMIEHKPHDSWLTLESWSRGME